MSLEDAKASMVAAVAATHALYTDTKALQMAKHL